MESIWWTMLRAAIILLSGIAVAGFLAPAFSNENERSTRTTTDGTAFNAVLQLERKLGTHLLSQKAALKADIDSYECSHASFQQTGTGVQGMDASRLRTIIDQSVVSIQTTAGSGTGFFVAQDMIVTNAHVVNGATSVRIYSEALYKKPVTGTVVATTGHKPDTLGSRDYALVSVSDISPDAMPLTMASNIKELDPVISAGFPGLFQKFHDERMPRMIIRRGELIGEMQQSSGANILAHSAEVLPGNSGGPLLNACGQVVGINTFIVWSSTDGGKDGPKVKTDFALPITDLTNFLDAEGIQLKKTSNLCT